MAEFNSCNSNGTDPSFSALFCAWQPWQTAPPNCPCPWASSWVWSMGSTYRKSEHGKWERPEYFFPASSHLRWYLWLSTVTAPSRWFLLHSHLTGFSQCYRPPRGWNSFLLWLVSKDFTHHLLFILVTLPIFQSLCPLFESSRNNPAQILVK